MRRYLRNWKPIAAAAFALVIGASSMVVGDGTKVSAANEIHVVAGGGEAGIAVNVYSPSSIAVNVGDTVTWTNPYTEPHSVSYLAAGDEHLADELAPINTSAAGSFDGSETLSSGLFASAGRFAGEGEFSVTFKKLGNYTFFCSIHPGMVVDVLVLDNVTPPAISQAGIDSRIQTGIDLGFAAADALVVPGPETLANGTKVWTVPTPPVVPYEGSAIDVLRFTPPELNIGVGDSVNWVNESFTPHTVTFIPGPPPEGFSPFVPDVSSTDYKPGTFLNSGLYGAVPGWIGTEFSLTFNTPGTYQYICALHADSGMVGVINVGGGITPPSTGNAGLADQGTGTLMMLAGLAALVGTMGVTALVAVRRNS